MPVHAALDAFDFRRMMVHKPRAIHMSIVALIDTPTMVPIAAGPPSDRCKPPPPDPDPGATFEDGKGTDEVREVEIVVVE